MTLDLEQFVDGDAARFPDVAEGAPFRAWRLKRLTPAEFAALGALGGGPGLSEAQLAYLAWWNLLAPTSHNTVPQRFRLDTKAGTLGVWLDRKFVLPASDATGRQAMVSLGCGIGQSAVAARCLGWTPQVEVVAIEAARLRPYIEGEPRYTEVARVSFRPAMGDEPALPPAYLEAMLRRKVVRAEYDERVKLEPAVAAELHGLVARHPKLKLHLLTDATTLLFMGKFQELADTTVMNRDTFALELGDWLLPNDATEAVGMRGREFGMSDEAARRIHQGLRRELRLLADEVAGFAKAGNIGMRSASAVAVITAAEDTPAAQLTAGQAYIEVTLALALHDFVTAMHAGITEVEAPNMALRARLRTLQRPTVVFRIGRPLEQKLRLHSSRPSLANVLLPPE